MKKLISKHPLVVSTLLLPFLVFSQTQAQSEKTMDEQPSGPSVRATYDPADPDNAWIDIDLINDCAGKQNCVVKFGAAYTIKVDGYSQDNQHTPIEFQEYVGKAKDGSSIGSYIASGLVGEKLVKGSLPSNPCVTSPFPMTHVLVKPAFALKDISLTHFDSSTSTFDRAELDRNGNNLLELPKPSTRFCVRPVHAGKPNGLFAVLSVRVNAQFGLSKGIKGFADTMMRSTQILNKNVQEVLDHIENLRQPKYLSRQYKKIDDKKMQLLIAAFRGLKAAAKELREDRMTYPSASDDQLRRAVFVALKAWDFSKDNLLSARFDLKNFELTDAMKKDHENTIRGKNLVLTNESSGDDEATSLTSLERVMKYKSFNRHIDWIEDHVKAISGIYGIPSNSDYGDSQFIVPVSNLLLVELDRMDSLAASVPAAEESTDKSSGLSSRAFKKTFFALQSALVDLQDEAFEKGDFQAPTIAKFEAVAEAWNSLEFQREFRAMGRASAIREDLRVFNAFFDALKALPIPGKKITFIKSPMSQTGLIRAGNGGNVRCELEYDGEFCYVDVMHVCAGRSACSELLTFSDTKQGDSKSGYGHWVALTSRREQMKTTKDLFGWANPGDEDKALLANTSLPGEGEVCSDLPIAEVLYAPRNEAARWTKAKDGLIYEMTDKLAAELPTPRYPPWKGYPKLNAKCVKLQNDGNEAAYAILSVKLKVDLDAGRSKLLPDVMKKASLRLKEALLVQKKSTDDLNGKVGDSVGMFKAYSAQLRTLIETVDTSWASKVNIPVTNDNVRQAAMSLYARSNLFQAFIKEKSLDGNLFSQSVGTIRDELARGFGFNKALSNLAPAPVEEIAKVKPPDSLVYDLEQSGNSIRAWAESAAVEARINGNDPQIAEEAAAARGIVEGINRLVEALKKTASDNRTQMYMYVTDEPVIQAALAVSESVSKASAALEPDQDSSQEQRQRILKANRGTLGRLQKIENLLSSINIKVRKAEGSRSGTRYTLLPLLENLHLALEESSVRMSMKWNDQRYIAAWTVLEYLRTIVIPAARRGGDIAAIGKLGELGTIWKKREFRDDFLSELLQLEGAKGRKRRHIHLSYGDILQDSLQAIDTIIETNADLERAAHGGLTPLGITIPAGNR